MLPAVMSASYDNNCSEDIKNDDLFMNVHERSRTVREQRIVGEHVTLNAKIRKLSNKQTNKHYIVHKLFMDKYANTKPCLFSYDEILFSIFCHNFSLLSSMQLFIIALMSSKNSASLITCSFPFGDRGVDA